MIIYQAHNKKSNMFYIGKTTKPLSRRIKQHYNDANCRSKTYFHKALLKYQESDFDWVIISKHNNAIECNNAEIFWINILKQCNHKVYNLTNGGDGGSRPGEMNPNYGKTLTEDTKSKISKTLKEYYKHNDGTMKGIPSPFKGKKHTDEVKRKISLSNKGRKRPDMVGANNKSARGIYCITTNESFDIASEAAIKYKSDLSSIIKCCKGKLKSVKGKQYRYQ